MLIARRARLAVLLVAFPTMFVAPGLAYSADTFRVPVTVVPGTVTFQPEADAVGAGSPPFSVSLPVSETVQVDSSAPACDGGSVVVAAEVVNNGIEIAIDGLVESASFVVPCAVGGRVEFDVEIEVPELGGTNTVVRLVPEVTQFDFPFYIGVQASMSTSPASSTTIPEVPVGSGGLNTMSVGWSNPNAAPPLPTEPTSFSPSAIPPLHWIPGDTLRFRVTLQVSMTGQNSVTDTEGEMRTRFEYRVTVPEPSAALSLPVGVAALSVLFGLRS